MLLPDLCACIVSLLFLAINTWLIWGFNYLRLLQLRKELVQQILVSATLLALFVGTIWGLYGSSWSDQDLDPLLALCLLTLSFLVGSAVIHCFFLVILGDEGVIRE